jgi:hypothetical protein
VGLADGGEFFCNDSERLVPLDLVENRCPGGIESSPHDRFTKTIRILVELFERRSLRADEALREDVVLVSTDALHRTVLDLDLEATGGLAERTGAKHDSIRGHGVAHGTHRCR